MALSETEMNEGLTADEVAKVKHIVDDMNEWRERELVFGLQRLDEREEDDKW